MKEKISSLLLENLWPDYLFIRDDSHLHHGHRGTDKVGDTHFFVTIVSPHFQSQSLPARHRVVYKALSGPFQDGVHALQIQAHTPEEWAAIKEKEHG